MRTDLYVLVYEKLGRIFMFAEMFLCPTDILFGKCITYSILRIPIQCTSKFKRIKDVYQTFPQSSELRGIISVIDILG